jgi:hypothetical protein
MAGQRALRQAQRGHCQSRDVHQISWIPFQLCSNLLGAGVGQVAAGNVAAGSRLVASNG